MSHKALVIGLGQIGMGYDLGADSKVRVVTLTSAFTAHHSFELVGGVDSNLERRELFAKHYALPVFSSVASALKETAPDVVAIAVPTEKHYSVLLEVLRSSGVKAVLCEKPLSYDLVEATEMVERSMHAGVRLYTNYMRRCDRAVIEVRRRLQHGEIVSPVKGVCWYTKGLFNNGSHYLNLLQYWLGEVNNFEIINDGRQLAGHDLERDVKLSFPSGEVYFHAVRDENFSHHSLELIAVNGRLRYERDAMNWQPAVVDKDNRGYVSLSSIGETIVSDTSRLQWCVADQIACDLAGEITSICSGEQGLSTIQILTQIKKRQ